MKAKDLIKLLQTKNPEAEVWLRDSHGGEVCEGNGCFLVPPVQNHCWASVLPLGQGHYPWGNEIEPSLTVSQTPCNRWYIMNFLQLLIGCFLQIKRELHR